MVTASARATHLLRALAAAGVRDVVLAPGSRSAPLALALFAADAAGDLRLHVRIDERTAGFLALGLTMGSRHPVAVVTTSGTAVGNLLPAVMEAHHGGRRVVVVSADRPAALRGTGANQTTWQDGIFGRFAPCADLAVDAAAAGVEASVAAAVARPGPSQLNVQFDAPLVPEGMPGWEPLGVGGGGAAWSDPSRPAKGGAAPALGEPLAPGPRTVVVAGDDAGSAARVFAESAGLPLLAEPTSGARAGEHSIRTYRLLLGAPTGAGAELTAQIERVVVVGHPTLSRPVTALLSRPDIELLAVRGRAGVATDPARRARVLDALPQLAAADATAGARSDARSDARSESTSWLTAWQQADHAVSERLDALVAELPELHALHVAAEISAALGPGQSLVVGSSNPVRDLDLMLVPYRPRERRLVVGNRGLAGIDGTISTAIGVDLGRAGAPRTTAVMGDLTFLHDAAGLILGPDEPRPDVTIVVVNDDGGSIFTLLEQGAPPFAAAFERVSATPHGVDLAALCAASGTAYERVRERAELAAALADHAPGLRVVEARVGRADRRALAARLAALAADLPGLAPASRAAPAGGMP